MIFSTAQRVIGWLILILVVLFLFAGRTSGQAANIGIITGSANLRAGPGIAYAIVGAVAKGKLVAIAGQDASGSWYQLESGQWITATLVSTAAKPPIATPAVTVVPTADIAPAIPIAKSVTANRSANLRAGPGTTFAVIGSVSAGQPLTVNAQAADGTWFQLADESWIASFLVTETTEADAAPVAATPLITPTANTTPTLAENGNAFVLVEKHLWDPYENGGSLDGPSVHCGDGRTLVVNVLDANGNRINGVAVQVQYGVREIYVTGAQGKGDGVAEFILGSGQDVKVVRDTDGSEVSSDLASGLVTDALYISTETLIGGKYCQDEASCKHFAETNGCHGHFSWTVTFKRQR